ncbi:uncharacterized protein [Diabrotica undecimpunctata]|uniref:uncharacterized protein n=1 Tax=Diabrotica undecimpunctata TaxID=50387 RepID=UPI003B63B0F1
MLDEWRSSILISVYKNKGTMQQCTNYRTIKLLNHTMKIWNRVIGRIIREETEISENQFGLMPGRSTTDAIFIRQEVLQLGLNRKGVSGNYIKIVEGMYKGIKASVRTGVGETYKFYVKVGLH